MQRIFLGPMDQEDVSDRLRSHPSIEQLSVQKKNLLQICKMCVKSLVDKSPFEAITDKCPHLKNLCVVLEHIFMHRIQARWSMFSSVDSPSYWHIFQHYAPPNTITSIEDMENVHTDVGRCRAWIRLALVQKRLALFMDLLLSRQFDLKNMYMQNAFLVSTELVELSGTLKCLDAIDFNLCLRDRDFDSSGDKLEIDYSPYLKFHQSDISRVDDIEEEHKLATFHHLIRFRDVGKDGVQEEDHTEENRDEESVTQLRKLLKTEREQKNYYEELVSVRDTQIVRLQKELDTAGRDNDIQKREMDGIIIELQEEISKLRSEVRHWQQKYQRALKTSSSSSTNNSTSSNRRSGIFSSIFGSGDTT